MIYDIAIIGAGPGGSNAAEYASVNGMSVVLFEEREVGGTCLNDGCVPSKTLFYSAKLYSKMLRSKEFAIHTSETALNLPELIERKDTFLADFAKGIKKGFKEKGITLINKKALLKGKNDDGIFLIEAGEKTFKSKKLLIATGSKIIIPPIEGIGEARFWTSADVLANKEVPKSLTVIGGGAIGMEFVCFFTELGTKVTVIEAMPKILGGMDEETSEALMKDFEKRGVDFHLSTEVTEIKNNTVYAKNKKGEFQVKSEKILISVGREPNMEGFGLENLKIRKANGAIRVNRFLQTSDPDVYACGDINGRSPLAHTASREGQVAINHLIGKKDTMNYNTVPNVVYTHPEVAGVGKTETELIEKGVDYSVMEAPMAFSTRFIVENGVDEGFCKIITDKKKRIIGGHIIGNMASEIIVNIAIAIEKKMTADEFSRVVFPHPTVSEIIHHAIFPLNVKK